MKDRISKEHLNLRKSHLDRFFSSKRKITPEKYSINNSKYKIHFKCNLNYNYFL